MVLFKESAEILVAPNGLFNKASSIMSMIELVAGTPTRVRRISINPVKTMPAPRIFAPFMSYFATWAL